MNNIPVGIVRRTRGARTSNASRRSRNYWSVKFIWGDTPPFQQKFVGTLGENALLFLIMISESKLCDG